MAPPILPPDVIRILSFHGPVEVWIGRTETIASGKVPIVPFEETSYLLVHRDSPIIDGLLRSCSTAVHARHPDGDYSLRMTGRAHAGLPLNRHSERYALQAWLPDGVAPSKLFAVPFVAENIELSREEVGERVRHFGPTPAGKTRPSTTSSWLKAAFGGPAVVFTIPAVVMPWVWLAVEGSEYPLRPIALTMAIVAGLAQLSAVRLLTLSIGFMRWRQGLALKQDAPVLSEAGLAPQQASVVGLVCLGLALILPGLLLTFWDGYVAVFALGSSGGWLLGPALLLNLYGRRPEPEPGHKRA